MKTILRYPGGKSRAVKKLLPLIPEDTEIVSPFFGGGSVEFALAERQRVHGYDRFRPLVNFWSHAMQHSAKIADIVKEYHPLEKEIFYELQQRRLRASKRDAAVFYVLNRSSFSGSTLSGGMSPGHPRFNEPAIERLRKFDKHPDLNNIHVCQADFEKALNMHPTAFAFLDPPYLLDNSNLYGKRGSTHKNFNHERLKKCLDKHPKWLLTYNDCPEIRELYKDYDIQSISWTYGMSKDKTSSEVVITKW